MMEKDKNQGSSGSTEVPSRRHGGVVKLSSPYHRSLRVADVATRWIGARARVKELRNRRDGLLCERAEPVSQVDYEDAASENRIDPGEYIFPRPTQERPCWKSYAGQDDAGRVRYEFPQSAWCANCQQRHAVNKALREAIQHQAALLRGLIRSVKTAESVEGGA